MTDPMHPLLLELGLEELPANSIELLSTAFEELLRKHLSEGGFSHGNSKPFGSMRHLGVLINEVPSKSQEKKKTSTKFFPENVAYRDGKPTEALIRFAADEAKTSIEALEKNKQVLPKGIKFQYEEQVPQKTLADFLGEILPTLLNQLPIAKNMRWGNEPHAFVRPLHSFIALHGSTILDLELLGIKSSNKTLGHRIHHPEAVVIHEASAFEATMREQAKIMVNAASRRQNIQDLCAQHAAKHQAELVLPDALLDELAGLSECPFVVDVPFDAKFLALPPEVLITVMQTHQRTIAMRSKKDNALLPQVLFVTNQIFDDAAQVAKGQTRVLSARFEDANFFYAQDLKMPLMDRFESLGALTLPDKLGSMKDKLIRMMGLAESLNHYFKLDAKTVERAVKLSKCDLKTMMVQELTELQGVMGEHYALKSDETPEVAQALREQYLPKHQQDECPKDKLSQLLSLTDKIDHLVSLSSIGVTATGSKDPYALRRAAVSMLVLLIKREIDLPLHLLLEEHLGRYAGKPGMMTTLETFIVDRLEGLGEYRDVYGVVAHEKINNPSQTHKKAQALDKMVKDGAIPKTLPEAHKRLNNILAKAPDSGMTTVTSGLFQHPSEQTLYDAISSTTSSPSPRGLTTGSIMMDPAVKPRDDMLNGFIATITELATLAEPLSAFFEHVMVMDDNLDIRNNRLNLLRETKTLLDSFGDFSCLRL